MAGGSGASESSARLEVVSVRGLVVFALIELMLYLIFLAMWQMPSPL